MPGLKYRKQIDGVFEVLKTPFMSDYTFQELKESMGKQYGLTYEQMEQDIEEGVQHGFTPDFQLKLFKDLFESQLRK
ncbi:hypothetical protein FVR03_08680 [Pontibacter qinzhouensis]|uniref:Uncharacterized protein n=1 Tax=Pontibacter qinzhouensis TaxID=2603253 RepID=A0A5C8K9W7_9BACT|nr:hypothetical protein [Pontibacter qinzhouensis]TXK47933.1 hypothetical protein FVR03_08680 [Pontibacter qinzhouensis]